MISTPSWVHDGFGISRSQAEQIGVSGWGIQLDENGEYEWSAVTLTLRFTENLMCFLVTQDHVLSQVPGFQGLYRLDAQTIHEYLVYYDSIEEFLNRWRANRYLRLGARSVLRPWELNSQDHFIIMLDDEAFLRHFISDPRGRLSHAEILLGSTLHKPLMKTEPPGYPVAPRARGWIRPGSIA
jgi:hypothetical protein